MKTDHPTVWEELPIMPVIETRALRSHELLLLSDFVSILAYGRDGVVWQSPRLCWDELKMGEVTRDVLEGTGYDPTGHSSGKTTMRFAVDLRTGRSLLHGPVSADGKPLW
ncbi:MAG TPA: hypothetical protein VMB47_19850 [Candidatus Aquilonibacter sp.]|nr:hypothetical protein [Candidatus Aquilonibacter sp.]